MRQFATFKLDEQLFGIEILFIREINQLMDITPVQKAPEYIRGLINLRGQIVTVFDLGKRFGLDNREISNSSHNIILKTNNELAVVCSNAGCDELVTSQDTIGFLVDDIGDVIEVEDHDIEPPPANLGEVDGRFLSGVVKLDNGLLVLLNVEEILSDNIV